jgi:hypothetical protein
VIRWSGLLPPDEQSTRSTPRAAASLASATESSAVQPPSTQSLAEMRSSSGGRPATPPHVLDDLEHQAHPAREVAAVAVGARVGQRREELVQQVAVRRVHLDHVEAGGERAAGGGDEVGAHLRDALLVERGGLGEPREGSSVGPTGTQPPSAAARPPRPSHGRRALALRPACASWIPASAPCA